MISLCNFAKRWRISALELYRKEMRRSKEPQRLFMKMKLFTLPNLLTLGNLFCGCLACVFIIYGIPIYIILILICTSLLFDLLDGMVARALKINSEIGIQLDSLADMVTFGFLPGILMFQMLGAPDIFQMNPENQIDFERIQFNFISLLGFLIPLFSALRLAKFNVDTEQSIYFKGLNTPANTILIFSLVWIQNQNGFIISTEIDTYILIGITLLSCWLLISNIPIFSFKFKGSAWKDNHFKYIFLGISLILLILFQMNALPFIILLYIIISIIFRKKIINA